MWSTEWSPCHFPSLDINPRDLGNIPSGTSVSRSGVMQVADSWFFSPPSCQKHSFVCLYLNVNEVFFLFTHNLHPCLLKLLCLTAVVSPCSDDDFDMSRYSSSGYSSAEVRCLRDQVSIHTLSTVSQHHFSDSADNPRPITLLHCHATHTRYMCTH